MEFATPQDYVPNQLAICTSLRCPPAHTVFWVSGLSWVSSLLHLHCSLYHPVFTPVVKNLSVGLLPLDADRVCELLSHIVC